MVSHYLTIKLIGRWLLSELTNPFIAESEDSVIVCGISTGFPVLFPTPRQITHVLLTRAPLYSQTEVCFLARLACVRHAASVDSEPGSNSQNKCLKVDAIGF